MTQINANIWFVWRVIKALYKAKGNKEVDYNELVTALKIVCKEISVRYPEMLDKITICKNLLRHH